MIGDENELVRIRVAAVGELPNDKVKTCNVCRDRGYPHEPIKIEKEYGRVLSNGTNEVKAYRLINYYNDTPHEHKPRYYLGFDLEVFLK